MTNASGTPVGAADPRTCGAKGGGVDILGAHIGSACQLKALTGAFCMAFGFTLMLAGVVVISGRSRSLRGAVGAAAGGLAGGPAGASAGAAVGSATAPVTTPTRAPAPAPAPVEDNYDAGFLDGLLSDRPEPAPRNSRQANRQAADLFDSLGLSAPLGSTDSPAF